MKRRHGILCRHEICLSHDCENVSSESFAWHMPSHIGGTRTCWVRDMVVIPSFCSVDHARRVASNPRHRALGLYIYPGLAPHWRRGVVSTVQQGRLHEVRLVCICFLRKATRKQFHIWRESGFYNAGITMPQYPANYAEVSRHYPSDQTVSEVKSIRDKGCSPA